MEGGGHIVALGTKQPVEPALAHGGIRLVDVGARLAEHVRELAQRYVLLLLTAADRVRLAADVRLEPFARAHEVEAAVVEGGRNLRLERAQLVPLAVAGQHGQPGLCGAQRELVPMERHLGGQDRVLELVRLLGELGCHHPALAGQEQASESLASSGAAPASASRSASSWSREKRSA